MTIPLTDSLDVAVEEFRRRLSTLADGDWSAPTPCPDWDVRYLVAHVVGGNRFASLVLEGASSDEAMAGVMGRPQLGADPLGDLTASADEQRTSFRRRGALEQIVSHPLGDITGERFLRMRVFDIALHAWDLATAVSTDPALDGDLVAVVLEIVAGEVEGMGFGITALPESAGASPQDRLLALTGRRP